MVFQNKVRCRQRFGLALLFQHQGHKKEIREREETIADKEKRIYDLKKKNQEVRVKNDVHVPLFVQEHRKKLILLPPE